MKFNLPDYEPEKVFELYESLGYSLWMIQSLELALSYYLVLAHKISIDTAVSQVQNIFEQTSKKTLGSVLNDIKKSDKIIDDEIIKNLDDILIRRNWLVHKIYATNQSDIFSPTKSTTLISKIREVGFDAIELSKLISNKTDEITIQKGFYTSEELDNRTQEIINSWKKDI